MMGVSPFFYTNLPEYGKNWLWGPDTLWYDRWEQVLDILPEFVQIMYFPPPLPLWRRLKQTAPGTTTARATTSVLSASLPSSRGLGGTFPPSRTTHYNSCCPTTPPPTKLARGRSTSKARARCSGTGPRQSTRVRMAGRRWGLRGTFRRWRRSRMRCLC